MTEDEKDQNSSTLDVEGHSKEAAETLVREADETQQQDVEGHGFNSAN